MQDLAENLMIKRGVVSAGQIPKDGDFKSFAKGLLPIYSAT